ncbi:MAG: NAD(+) synthase [Deltaproteobacteria bacterium]|jgi:NAD+ synthase (glutamine-hydrolysing)|nr:NAD(+) synthase [Deltaproteobacteria bacterium]
MKIKVGISSFNPAPGKLLCNAKKIRTIILDAINNNFELLIFPEMALSGYCLGDLHTNSKFIKKQWELLQQIILPATNNINLVLGLALLDNNNCMHNGEPARYNGYAAISNGKIIRTGKKTLLINEGVLEDSRYFLPGNKDEISPISFDFGKKGKISMGVMICQEMWDDHSPHHPAKILAAQGAQALLVLNSSPFHTPKFKMRVETARLRVKETGLPLFYANSSGIQDIGKNIVVFDGGNFAITYNTKLETGNFFKDELLPVDFSPNHKITNVPQLDTNPPRIPILKDALVYTLKSFLERNPFFKGAVLGLSGGIDSALDALLLVEAIGAENLLCLNLPSRFNSKVTRSIAGEIAEKLRCEYIIHPIEEVFNKKIIDLKAGLGHEPMQLTLENMQARERGNILMQYSQERGLMVIGNGNKTEMQRGYATLYGDILGAIMPLGDVSKLDIFQLAKYIDPKNEFIPAQVLELKPSAELSAAQNIEKNLGDPFDYYIESPLGTEIIENKKSPLQLKKLFRERSLDPALWLPDKNHLLVYDKFTTDEFYKYAKDLVKAVSNSYFKRVQAPPVPVMTPRAFGLDFRESLFPPEFY